MSDLRLTPHGLWFLGRRFPCAIGKSGIRVQKREGDGATPAGRHRIVGMMYRADRLAQPQPWAKKIGPQDLWSDDSEASEYNQLVCMPYAFSHEAMRRADPLYDIVFITDYNYPEAQSGLGSAIFLHQWRRPRFPTEGCIALRRDHLKWIAERVPQGALLEISQSLATDA
ncbi:L,D-transpeptidase family protein [Cognatishimia activa]|uniref:L,D-transpeptidase family protein n=1 Tax=Cognatishimia activa TaxID=1715691 RepID=UPI001FD85128|nr:L,D-transpeptidase family protein [Cognatishimia activa]